MGQRDFAIHRSDNALYPFLAMTPSPVHEIHNRRIIC